MAIGERVRATIGYTGPLRPGVITAEIKLPNQDMQYMVRFDGAEGPSGPCGLAFDEDVYDRTMRELGV